MRFAELDAVTVDGYGTLVRLVDPVPALRGALAERGVERSDDEIRAAFLAEVEHYKPSCLSGRDQASLAALRLECTGVFLSAAKAAVEPASFVDDFLAAIVLEPEPGAVETLHRLRAHGLELAVVSNWDVGLAEHLERLGLASLFSAIATTAEAGAPKPEPAVFELALGRLRVDPARALHVGDEDGDEQGAAAAGLRFAPAPLATAFAGWS